MDKDSQQTMNIVSAALIVLLIVGVCLTITGALAYVGYEWQQSKAADELTQQLDEEAQQAEEGLDEWMECTDQYPIDQWAELC